MVNRRLWLPVIVLIGLVVILQLVVVEFNVPQYLVPAPSKVMEFYASKGEMLIGHAVATLSEAVGGLLLAVVIGVLVAIGLVYSALLFDSIYPLLIITQVLPKSALAPLFLIWFGYGIFPKVIMVFFISFFPIVVNTALGLASVEPEMLDLVRSLRATKLQTFIKIRLPNSLPHMFSGFKIAATISLIGAVVAEFVGAEKGLGFIILVAQYEVNTPLMFASFVLLAIIGMMLFYSMVLVERFLLPWRAGRYTEGTYGA